MHTRDDEDPWVGHAEQMFANHCTPVGVHLKSAAGGQAGARSR
ncbi:hypothetical protein [Streptomyces sp. 3N207]